MARSVDRDRLAATLGPASLAIAADVSDPESVVAAVRQVGDAWGGVDVLVNNAGLHRGGKVGRLPLDDWDAVLATNLSGPLHCVRAALPHMGEGGSIVNVGAVVGFRGFSGDSAYGSSKAGLAGLTRVLAIELAPRLIRVNLFIPGFVITEMTQQIDERAREQLLERIPLRRAGTEEEMAEAIWWIAGSTYMTGSVVAADGGLLSGL
jgi:NAD(P)-dependent dehydrogenase (short-subunit alcohol dehydrogenase family)